MEHLGLVTSPRALRLTDSMRDHILGYNKNFSTSSTIARAHFPAVHEKTLEQIPPLILPSLPPRKTVDRIPMK